MITVLIRIYRNSWLARNQSKFGMIAIMAVCIFSRGSHIAWDGLYQTHPDERYINLVATSIEFFGDGTDGYGPGPKLNPFYWPEHRTTSGIEIPRGEPRLFAYGHAPLYLRVLVAKSLSFVGKVLEDIDNFIIGCLFLTRGNLEILQMVLVGRYMSVFADCIALMAVYYIGEKLQGKFVGIMSAGLFAVSVQFIQQAHFGTFDSMLTAAVTIVLFILVTYVGSQRLWHLNLAGCAIGLAVGIKATAVLLVLPAFTAVLCCELVRVNSVKRSEARRVYELWIVPSLCALGVFILCNPYAVIEWQEYLRNIALQSYMVRGLVDWPFVLQYKNTQPYIYHIIEQGRWTLGWPLTIVMYAGTLALAIKIGLRLPLRKADYGSAQRLVLVIWVVCYFGLIAGLQVKYPRYMLPVIPIQIVFASILLVDIIKKFEIYGWALLVIVVGSATIYAIGYVNMHDKPHPWIVASNWIYANSNMEDSILIEKWDHPLPIPQVRDAGKLIFREEYDTVALDLASMPDTENKLRSIVKKLAKSNYIIVASNRNYGPVLSNPELFRYTVKYYQGLFDGTLGYSLVLAETRYPNFAGISLRGDPISSVGVKLKDNLRHYEYSHSSVASDESFTVYDHPLVLVFYNESKLAYGEMMEVIVGKQ